MIVKKKKKVPSRVGCACKLPFFAQAYARKQKCACTHDFFLFLTDIVGPDTGKTRSVEKTWVRARLKIPRPKLLVFFIIYYVLGTPFRASVTSFLAFQTRKQ